jgi:hypothetical protein
MFFCVALLFLSFFLVFFFLVIFLLFSIFFTKVFLLFLANFSLDLGFSTFCVGVGVVFLATFEIDGFDCFDGVDGVEKFAKFNEIFFCFVDAGGTFILGIFTKNSKKTRACSSREKPIAFMFLIIISLLNY